MGRVGGAKLACRTSGDSGYGTSDRVNAWREPGCRQKKRLKSDNPLCSTTGLLLRGLLSQRCWVAEICRNSLKFAVDCRKVSWIVVMC